MVNCKIEPWVDKDIASQAMVQWGYDLQKNIIKFCFWKNCLESTLKYWLTGNIKTENNFDK